jgi:heme/copper-type cytochrome/quinol oxidase subunit 2
MNKHIFISALIWIIVSVASVGLYALYQGSLFPIQASEQAVVVDEAFHFLAYLSIPIIALVVVLLGYSALVFRGEARSGSVSNFHRSNINANSSHNKALMTDF